MPSKISTRLLLCTFFAIFSASLSAQNDSLLLQPKILRAEDIVSFLDLESDELKIVSGSRFPIEAGDLPYSVYVITKEEIRANGYETLVDALKMAPGIRVSQPGSAIDGETFLMRGLLGNAYTKILLNDVPIKPIFAGGMPIGAQLPIKEAERIEIIYGVGSALYGADGAAGVINIITRQSDKPVFMQADLAIGGGSYSSVNVMFGGKLGRDKHVMRFFAYGSNVIFEQRPIFHDPDFLYDPTTYQRLNGTDTSFVFLQNYRGTANRPELSNTPHLSRKFGFTANLGRYTLSFERMYRRDHSALGLNPLAVSYSNPGTYTGEFITRVNLNLFKAKKKHNRKTDITYMNYKIDDRSSVLFVRNRLALLLRQATDFQANQLAPNSPDSLANALANLTYQRYFDGIRYTFGYSDEFRIEHVRNYQLLTKLSLTIGGNLRGAFGIPSTNFLQRPAKEGDFETGDEEGPVEHNPQVFPLAPQSTVAGEVNVYGQLFFNGKHLKMAVGIFNTNIADVGLESTTGRFAGLYRISPKLKIRASYGKAFRIPSQFFQANTYNIWSNRLPGIIGRNYTELTAEETISRESGVRLNWGKWLQADLTFFSNTTSNLLGFVSGAVQLPGDSVLVAVNGYQNTLQTETEFTGWQLHLKFSNLTPRNQVEVQWNITNQRAKVSATMGFFDNFAEPGYIGWLHQARLILRPVKDFTLIFDGVLLRDQSERTPNQNFFTLDVTGRYAITDRFDAYVKAVNFFDEQYAGLNATGTPDDLRYNPQTGAFLRLGMNYYLE